MDEVFESYVRSAGDIAGVYEYDRDTSNFYLCRLNADAGNKVIASIKISVGRANYAQQDVEISWLLDEHLVCSSISGQVWAVSGCTNSQRFGGHYGLNALPTVPLEGVASLRQVQGRE